MTSPLILSLETATIGGSVWLGYGSVPLATRIGDAKVSQSASLLRDVSDCLDEAGVKLAEVDLFTCAAGPGSFTGLRIGIATLKALAASLTRPCVGIPTLPAVALSGGPSDATVALLPAGRGEVFAQMFSVADNDVVKELDRAAHLTPAKLLERYARIENLKWAGNGAPLQRDLLEAHARAQGIHFFDEVSIATATQGEAMWYLAPLEQDLAKQVAALALQKFETGGIQSPESLRAIYVRPSDAELNQCL